MLTQVQLMQIMNQANNIYNGIFGQIMNNPNQFGAIYNDYVIRYNARNNYRNIVLGQYNCIRYFAIGEAPPPPANGTYFYFTAAINNTAWFNVPLQHFFPNHAFLINSPRTQVNKTLALNDLAGTGFYLDDISPLPFMIEINRSKNIRYRMLMEYLFYNYFIPFVLIPICPFICNAPIVRTILMGTKVADRVVYDMITANLNICNKIVLKPAGICGVMPRYTLSSACATNSPILNLFNCAII